MASGTDTKKPKAGGAKRRLALAFGMLRSRITLTMLVINGLALAIMGIGATHLGGLHDRLLRERLNTLAMQAAIIAEHMAEEATTDDDKGLIADQVPTALTAIYIPDSTRARVFNTVGELIEDADSYAIRGIVNSDDLPELDPDFADRLRAARRDPPSVNAAGELGQQFETLAEEVAAALELRPDLIVTTRDNGIPFAYSERRTASDEIYISVSVPIQRVQLVRGVVNVQAAGFDDIIQEQRDVVFAVGALAAIVAVGASMVGALFITLPVRRLSEAARRIRNEGPRNASVPRIRGEWEVGRLSRAMDEMTEALVARINAIETFSADVAHELKNPLTSLRSALETMSSVRDERRKARLLGVMRHDLIRLDRLITDISSAGRVDAELSRAKAAPLDLQAFLLELVEMYRITRSEHDPDVVFDPGLNAKGARVRAAHEPLGHVFRNLIDNARTFSPAHQPVRIGLRREMGASGAVAVAVVEDRGPGVPEDSLERIFDRFYTTRSMGGSDSASDHSGLGLAIARQIIEAHDGRIWADNLVGDDGTPAGARFSIALPLAS